MTDRLAVAVADVHVRLRRLPPMVQANRLVCVPASNVYVRGSISAGRSKPGKCGSC
jgi:hypothetical protein